MTDKIPFRKNSYIWVWKMILLCVEQYKLTICLATFLGKKHSNVKIFVTLAKLSFLFLLLVAFCATHLGCCVYNSEEQWILENIQE